MRHQEGKLMPLIPYPNYNPNTREITILKIVKCKTRHLQFQTLIHRALVYIVVAYPDIVEIIN